jgi:hypothetical protein
MLIKTSVITIIILFNSSVCFCQVPDDSLKRICMRQYVAEEDTVYLKKRGNGPYHSELVRKNGYRLAFHSANELFANHFKDFKIFLLNYLANELPDHGPNYYLKFYVIDVNTGEILRFRNNQQFLNFINSSVKPIAALDKSYLYLALYLNIFQKYNPITGISIPREYSESVRNGTQKQDEEVMFKSWNVIDRGLSVHSVIPAAQRTQDILASNTDSIIVYAFNYFARPLPNSEITYRCKFMFDGQNNLNTIRIDTLQ